MQCFRPIFQPVKTISVNFRTDFPDLIYISANKQRFFSMRILLSATLLLSVSLSAQDYLGYSYSNYAGIAGASYNPATLADNNYSLDILLVGASVEAGNNYVGFKRSMLNQDGITSADLYRRDRNTKKAVFFRNEILLPGVMFSNDKYGWGVDLKMRTYINVDGVGQPLAHLLITEFEAPDYYQPYKNKHIGITGLSWFEIGGTYARTIFKGAEHFVSVGARPKFLLGAGAMYAFVNNLSYEFTSDSTVIMPAADLNFGHSDNIGFNPGSYSFGFNPGLGVDGGLIYEHRPEELQERDKESKNPRPWPGIRNREEYLYRIGLSLTDLGFIHFRKGQLSDHYTANSQNWDIDDDALDATAPTPVNASFDDFVTGSEAGEHLWMRLPLAFNANFDYRIRKNLYVNGSAFSAIYLRGNDGKKVHELTRLTVTPRWDARWVGLWTPVSFSRLGNVTLGTGVRLGPLVVGTNDILMWAFKNKKFHSADAYFLLKVPLFPVGKGNGKGRTKGKRGGVDDCPTAP